MPCAQRFDTMGLLEKEKINRGKKEKGLKKKINKLKQRSETNVDETAIKKSISKLKGKSETEDGVTAKKSVNKLKRKNETAHGETTEKSTDKLKRKSETAHDGKAKKPKKQRTEDEVSSDQNGKTDFINKSDGDSGDNAGGNDAPSSRNEQLRIHRLFVLTPKKIITEEIVKNLHPDVVSVRFPRKKRTRWCWAVFDSEEKAGKALEELKNLKDVIVRKPIDKSEGSHVKKKKTPGSKMKKQIKTKLLQTWL